jgi:hypothetical protein
MFAQRAIFGDANAGAEDIGFGMVQFEDFDAWGVKDEFLGILQPGAVAAQFKLGAALGADGSGGGESGGGVGERGEEQGERV